MCGEVSPSPKGLTLFSLFLKNDKKLLEIPLKNDNILSKILLKNDKNSLKIPLNFDNFGV